MAWSSQDSVRRSTARIFTRTSAWGAACPRIAFAVAMSGFAVASVSAASPQSGAVEKTKKGAEKVVDKTKEGLSKTGEVITDGWITTRVKSKFVGEDLLKDSDINVDTNDHVVTLKGTVMSAAARARAVEQAKEVEGVQKVVDLLTIGPKKP